VSPGDCDLIANKRGFLSAEYGGTNPLDPGFLLKISGGDRLRDIILRLSPAGSISGQVIDPDGEPAPGYEVVLWARHRRAKGEPYKVSDEATTNRRGEYHFDDLMPDRYLVSTSPALSYSTAPMRQIMVDAFGSPTKLRELRTFYPSAFSIAAAQKIQIGPGHEQAGLDIRIQRGQLLSVTGRIADGGAKEGYSVARI
jgi:hypothetical protein